MLIRLIYRFHPNNLKYLDMSGIRPEMEKNHRFEKIERRRGPLSARQSQRRISLSHKRICLQKKVVCRSHHYYVLPVIPSTVVYFSTNDCNHSNATDLLFRKTDWWIRRVARMVAAPLSLSLWIVLVDWCTVPRDLNLRRYRYQRTLTTRIHVLSWHWTIINNSNQARDVDARL